MNKQPTKKADIISASERRQIENEMIFRRANEVVGDALDDLDAMHIADDNPQFIRDTNLSLDFKCECSDENCDERISIKLTEYQKIHINRDTFVVKLDHEVDPIEQVISTGTDYSVVMKNNFTKEPGTELNKTQIDNS